jgi:putative oxidoreductase
VGIGGALVTRGSQTLFGWLGGPGELSIDHARGHRFNRGWMRGLSCAAVAIGPKVVVAERRYTLATSVREPVDADAL